jgi:phenylacetate-CoA ligase
MRRWLAWHMFCLQERAKGHSTSRLLREMEAADSLSVAELERIQSQKLVDLMTYACTHVPYIRERIREAGIEPSSIREARDLRRLPLMRKADIRQHRAALRSEIAGRLSPFSTGGSTGEPLVFDLAKRRVAARVACRQRVARWWGMSIGDPELALWGSPVELTAQDWLRSLRDRLMATRLLPAFEMNEPTMSGYLDILEKQGCRQLFGYPSSIYQLCLLAQRQRRSLRRVGVKVAFVTGEVLLPHQRELISETLACPVADGYGGRDSGFIAHECPQGGMHLLADAVITEIVDDAGRPAPADEAGEIVVTDLYSHEAPFIRYATGDMATLSSRRCPCGRALPLLEGISGRSNDSVVTPDGRVINSLALIYAVREVEGVEQFRICQKAADRFHVQLVCPDQRRSDGEERIRKGWTQLMRSPVQITFEYPPALPSERSGKFRHVVSEITPGNRREEQLDDAPAPVSSTWN